MRCRKCIRDNGYNPNNYNLVRFGSYGLQNPYAIIFKLKEIDDMPSTKVVDKIITNDVGDQGCEVGNIIIKKIDFENKKMTYVFKDGFDKETITICYYNELMFNPEDGERISTNITKQYELSNNDLGELNFDILMMARRWKDDLSSYAEKQEGTASSLIQRLSVIQGELWYRINYGLPLFQNVRDKGIMDSVIIDIILSHPDIASIESYVSGVDRQGNYTFDDAKIVTIFNEIIELARL